MSVEMRVAPRIRLTLLIAAFALGCGSLAAASAEAAFPGTNGRIAFARDDAGFDGDIVTMTGDGIGLINLTTSEGVDEGDPAFSPNGKRIAFTSDAADGRDIWVMRSDGSDATRLTGSDGTELSPSWSANGERIVFVSDRDSEHLDFDVYSMRADGTDVDRLTRTPARDNSPAWSPAGGRIAFTRFHADTTGEVEVLTMRPDGSDVERLTRGRTTYAASPSWSPDGTRLAFTGAKEGTGLQIFTIGADSHGLDRLTGTDAWNVDPAYSPDGKRIAFTSERETNDAGPDDVYRMRADGSHEVPLTSDPANEVEPDWQPGTAVIGG